MSNGHKEENIDIIIAYKPNTYNKDKLRLFGGLFVKMNRSCCKIIYKDKEYELK